MDEQTKIATTTGGAIGISAVASLKKWPAVVGAGAFAVVALTGYLKSGSVESVTLARLIWLWELYVFAHLGLSFLIAAMIGMTGCEMRAFHDLYSRATGVTTKEHCCPIGPLHHIDQWQGRRRDFR